MNRNTLTFLFVPAAVLVGLALLFFNKMAFSNLILARGDTFLYFYPYWHAAAEALSEWRVPFWNPAIFMGAPLLANSQVGFFYPLNWPLWLLLDTPYAASASIVLHILIAAFGTYLLGRRGLFLGRSGALVAAASFALGGYLTAQVEHINQLQGLAWLPWFLIAVEYAWGGARRAWLSSLLATAVLFALQLVAGHTQTTFITTVAILIWLAGGWFGRRYLPGAYSDGSATVEGKLSSPLSALIAGGLLAAALAAVQLLPTLELMQYSSRAGGLPANEAMSFSLPPHLLVQALLPTYGQSLFTEYVAFLPLVLLALAFVGGWQWRKRAGVLPALALALGGFLLSLGAYNPLYWLLVRLPGFSFFRAPARWLVLYALGLSLLAGIGWHLLWHWAGEENSSKERRVLLRSDILPPLLLFLVVLMVLVVWGFAAGFLVDLVPLGPEAPFERPSLLTGGGWLVEVLLAFALLAVAASAGSAAVRRAALLGLLVVGLFAGFFASRTLPYNSLTTPEAYFDLRPSTSRILAESGYPPDRMLSLSDIFFDPGDQAEIDSIYGDQLSEQARYDYTVAIKQKEINAPNLPIIYNLASVDGFDGGILPLRDYGRLMSATIANGQETTDGRLRELLEKVPETRWLDLFNARYLITDKTGDLWLDGIYYDRQHPVTLIEGESVPVAYLPEFEADEIRLLATAQPATVDIVTRDGESLSLEPELMAESLYRAELPYPAVLAELEVESCAQASSCTLEGITLVDTRDGAFQSLVPGSYRLIHSGDVKIYENSDVLPRAFIAGDWLWAADVQESLDMLSDPDFDGRTTAVIVGDPAIVPQNERAQPGSTGIAAITGYRPEQVVVETESATGGLLVLTDAHYPGWRATVDGESASIYQTDGLFRGVFVPEGEHQVIFQFDSAAYRLGLTVFIFTVVTITGVLIAIALNLRKKR